MFYEKHISKKKKQLIMSQNALESRDRDERRGQTMKKVAIISDIHGNLTAFQQVIKDAEKQRVDEYWFLGDLLMPGPGAESILELLNQINTTHFIRGNWDDFLFENILGISKDYINEPQTTYMVELIKYVKSHLDSKYVQQVQQWPISKNIHFEGLNILLTHNHPQKNYGHELLPYEDQANFDKLLFNEPYDLAIYAHVHHQLLRTSSNGQLVINPGSIGQPYTDWKKFRADRRAQYAVLSFNQGLVDVNFRKVAYSIDDELKIAEANDLPFRELYQRLFAEGITFTHDNDALNEQIEKHNYKSDALEYLKKLESSKDL